MRNGLPDLTEIRRQPGVGMDTRLLYLCGHKALSTGGKFRGRIPELCIDCNKPKEKK